MLGELVPCGGGDTIPLTEPKLLVGRRSHCDICLRFNNVSSHHCEFELKGAYWHVRDLNSSNGTFVNGIRVDAQSLRPGDEVMIAKHSFIVQYDVDPSAPAPEEDNPFEMSLMEKAGLSVERRPKRSRSSAGSNRSGSRSPRRNASSAKDDFIMEWLSEE